MSDALCSRRWEVEAVRDGRVRGKDADSLARHLLACSDCAREAREVSALAEGIRSVPVRHRDELSVRRQRQGLLLALEQSFETSSERPRRRGLALGLALAALLSLAVLGVLALLHAGASGPNVVEVTAAPGAAWHEASDRDIDRLFVVDGEVRLSVHRSSPSARVLIVLPDGVIEDLGTVLRVRVSGHVTQSIAIEEGLVRVALQGLPEMRLAAGQDWSRPPTSTPSATSVAADPHVTPASSSHGEGEPHALATASAPGQIEPRAGLASKAVHGATRRASPAASPGAASADRSEDDAYLAIVGLLEQGRAAEARAAALDYLARFPHGFRRAEVAAVAKR